MTKQTFFVCDYCNYHTQNLIEIKEHETACRKEHTHKCPTCGKVFITSGKGKVGSAKSKFCSENCYLENKKEYYRNYGI